MDQSRQRVTIVGGGFSGAMLAARLAEEGVATFLVERTGRFGPGVAYAHSMDVHRLNVRAGRMGAVEGDPAGFVRWLQTARPELADPEAFLPRALYGRYVRERLEAVEARFPGRISRVVGDAVAIDGRAVRLADGRTLDGRAVVIATGNPPPRRPAAPHGTRRIADPWTEGALDSVGTDHDVLILGSGLTMVDVVLALAGRGWRGRAAALSRRGLRPRAHGEAHDAPIDPAPELLAGPASGRLASARRLARASGWRSLMEGLRPLTAEIWSAAELRTRSRWLRHLRPWWDVHRHRIAPDIDAALADLSRAGRLEILAGRSLCAKVHFDGVELTFRPRGTDREQTLSGQWLIDCTGPGHDPRADPLTRSLFEAGLARLDPLGLGLDVDGEGRVLDDAGSPAADLFVLGPPARAALWETVAAPDIRLHIEQLASRLARSVQPAPVT